MFWISISNQYFSNLVAYYYYIDIHSVIFTYLKKVIQSANASNANLIISETLLYQFNHLVTI